MASNRPTHVLQQRCKESATLLLDVLFLSMHNDLNWLRWDLLHFKFHNCKNLGRSVRGQNAPNVAPKWAAILKEIGDLKFGGDPPTWKRLFHINASEVSLQRSPRSPPFTSLPIKCFLHILVILRLNIHNLGCSHLKWMNNPRRHVVLHISKFGNNLHYYVPSLLRTP